MIHNGVQGKQYTDDTKLVMHVENTLQTYSAAVITTSMKPQRT